MSIVNFKWKLPALKITARNKENKWWLVHPLCVPISSEGRSIQENARHLKRNTVIPKNRVKQEQTQNGRQMSKLLKICIIQVVIHTVHKYLIFNKFYFNSSRSPITSLINYAVIYSNINTILKTNFSKL